MVSTAKVAEVVEDIEAIEEATEEEGIVIATKMDREAEETMEKVVTEIKEVMMDKGGVGNVLVLNYLKKPGSKQFFIF